MKIIAGIFLALLLAAAVPAQDLPSSSLTRGTWDFGLFAGGGTGLGKTHLVHAIAHRVHGERPDARIIYVSAERFTNDFIASIQHHRMDEFRARYRASNRGRVANVALHEGCFAGPAFGPMTGHANDIVAGAEQPQDHAATDHSAGPGDGDPHGRTPNLI